MLAKYQIQKLVNDSKVSLAIGLENLLPINNNKCILDVQGITSVTVVENTSSDDLNPVAFGVLNELTKNQAYCSIIVTSQNYNDNFVTVEQIKTKNSFLGLSDENSSNFLLKITDTILKCPNNANLPQYYKVFVEEKHKKLFECVFNFLIEKTLGHNNFYLNCNLTVDLYDASAGVTAKEDILWRDCCGFLVFDQYFYFHIEIDRKNFKKLLKNAIQLNNNKQQISFQKLTEKNIELCINYDQSISLAINRQNYIEYLLQLYELQGTIAFNNENEPVGYVISHHKNILQCYAEEPLIANQLLLKHLELESEKTNDELISFFTYSKKDWIAKEIQNMALNIRRVRRFHTRIVPKNVNWSKVFVLNVGVYLF